MKSTYLVTGSTGFIGKKITEKLLSLDKNVIAICRDLDKAKKIKQLKGAKIIQLDITNEEINFDIPKSSTLIHCAWDNVRDVNMVEHNEEYPSIHLLFIKRMIQKGINKVFVSGSQAEYGIKYGPLSPESPTKPETQYGIGKDRLHKSLRQMQKSLDFKLAWSRFFYLHGKGQDPNTVMMQFEKALEENLPVFNMSHGEQLVDYLEIDEAASKAVNLILDLQDGIYNICKGEPISLRRLLEERMVILNKNIELNTGYYDYRDEYSIAMWGKE